MQQLGRKSAPEWEFMKVVWSQAHCSAGVSIETLYRLDGGWSTKTVKEFLNRLVKKKALGFRKEGGASRYRPLVKEDECVDAASESFLRRVFAGSLKPMLAHFVERRKLSAEEIRDLKRLLENQ